MADIQYGYWRTDKPAEPGYSQELISAYSDKNKLDTLETWPTRDDGTNIQTLIQAFENLVQTIPNHPWLGTKQKAADGKITYTWMSVQDAYQQSKNFGAGLMALNLIPEVEAEGKQWRMLGIQSKNRVEWNICHMGNYMTGGTTVALYDTLGQDASRFVCHQTQLTTICCSKDLVQGVIKLKADDPDGKMTKLENIVQFDGEIDEKDKADAAVQNIKIIHFQNVMEEGAKNTSWAAYQANPNDVYMLSYTSGTTGDPKGVKLQHKMVLQCAQATNAKLQSQVLTKDDIYISYLPAAHSFEQALQAMSLVSGCRCGFYGGNPLALVSEDLPALKPTIFASVPRIFNRIYSKIQDTFNSAKGCKASLVNNAVNTKLANYRSNARLTHGTWDKIIFKKVKALIGGKVRVMLTGSAPISAEVLDFLKICFCCPICEGYGLTETSAGSFLTLSNDPISGHVGGPQGNVKLRLKDIPEMGYSSQNQEPTGECLLWGTSVMPGYFKNPEKTAEAFDGPPENGWLKTGDVVKVFPNGSIKIIDRAKNIFKLSQGEYVAPEKVENILIQSPWLGQVWLHGDSLNNHVLLIAVIDEVKFKQWAEQNGKPISQDSLEDQTLREDVYADVVRLCKANKLNSLETPKQFQLLKEPFTIENDLLTPTMKLKRNVARRMFADTITKLYALPPLQAKK